jgi:hypothetical protein
VKAFLGYLGVFGAPSFVGAALMYAFSPYLAVMQIQDDVARGDIAAIASSVDIDATRDYYFDWSETQRKPYMSMAGKVVDGVVGAVGGDGVIGTFLKIFPLGDIYERAASTQLRANIERLTEIHVASYVAQVIPGRGAPRGGLPTVGRLRELVQVDEHGEKALSYDYTGALRFELSRSSQTIILCRHGFVRWKICGLHGEELQKAEARALLRGQRIRL